ncbi:MAG: RNA polymerase factor sigma-54 [Desulfarculaceae bacterium]|jgi:RNA polymerase sigma-54 factor
MGLEIKQTLRLSQQLVMTPQLQQAIKLLQLSRLELVDTINQELLENPLLDVSEETPSEEKLNSDNGEPGPSSSEKQEEKFEEIKVEEKTKEEFDWENYLGEYSSAPASSERSFREDHEAPSYENMLSKSPSLREHLLWQLGMTDLPHDQILLGTMIIESLNPDGYLTEPLEELAGAAGVDPAQAEKVLQIMQQFDPLGVGARDLGECLRIQAVEIYPGYDLVHEILENHLGDLEKGHYQNITKKLKVSLDEVAEALEVIRTLEPKPGRSINDEQPQYITPDIYVYKVDGKYEIVLNEDGLPKLKVNNFYKDSLGNNTNPEAKEYVQNKLRSALWLIRSIHQRQRTIYKVTETIVNRQIDFFERGIAFLKPMVLRDVAEEVGMHESTISRVTTNKYVHTPRGVFELKYFFNSGINRVEGGAVASEAVKERIRALIAEEQPGKPLSDQAIANLLKEENIDIARRTVAKYREVLGILPSSRRRRILDAAKKPKTPKKYIDKPTS